MSKQGGGNIDWKALKTKAPFPPEAYEFVRDGLSHTVRAVYGEAVAEEMTRGIPSATDRHVSGQQLCLGLRDFALRQYGMLAHTVLDRWGVRRTDDFGRMVFAMIEAGFMNKSEQDSLDDFAAVYDFDEAFSATELI